jgi:sugar O-acyltransferase (sialic acid O-acetyltransferase NeuD family)
MTPGRIIGGAYIIGGGGHAHVVASLLAVRPEQLRYIVPNPTTANEISETAFFAQIDDYRAASVYMGIGNNAARKRAYDRLIAAGIRPAAAVAKHAFIAADVQIGAGAVLCPGVVVNAGARIGANTIINTLSGIDHDCVIGDHTQICPGVSLAGSVVVGSNCFFGVKSAVGPNVTIGCDVTVCAGSVVLKNVPDGVRVAGIPASIVVGVAQLG